MTLTDDQMCAECGMACFPNEYHPYAACLMFKGCRDSETVRANLSALSAQPAKPAKLTDEQWKIINKAWYAIGADIAGLEWLRFAALIAAEGRGK